MIQKSKSLFKKFTVLLLLAITLSTTNQTITITKASPEVICLQSMPDLDSADTYH